MCAKRESMDTHYNGMHHANNGSFNLGQPSSSMCALNTTAGHSLHNCDLDEHNNGKENAKREDDPNNPPPPHSTNNHHHTSKDSTTSISNNNNNNNNKSLKRKKPSQIDEGDEVTARKQVCTKPQDNDGLLLYARREEWLVDLKAEAIKRLLDGHNEVEIFELREEAEETSSDFSDMRSNLGTGHNHHHSQMTVQDLLR
jgi:hypothetical protein